MINPWVPKKKAPPNSKWVVGYDHPDPKVCWSFSPPFSDWEEAKIFLLLTMNYFVVTTPIPEEADLCLQKASYLQDMGFQADEHNITVAHYTFYVRRVK